MARTAVSAVIILSLVLASDFAFPETIGIKTVGFDDGAETTRNQDYNFTAGDSGVVLDMRTGLMWAAKDNGRDITWEEAKAYCEHYSAGGYSDWRMPTQDELAGLYSKDTKNRHGYGVTELIDITACCPWASETRDSEAAYLLFTCGGRGWHRRSHANFGRALPVRGEQGSQAAAK